MSEPKRDTTSDTDEHIVVAFEDKPAAGAGGDSGSAEGSGGNGTNTEAIDVGTEGRGSAVVPPPARNKSPHADVNVTTNKDDDSHTDTDQPATPDEVLLKALTRMNQVSETFKKQYGSAVGGGEEVAEVRQRFKSSRGAVIVTLTVESPERAAQRKAVAAPPPPLPEKPKAKPSAVTTMSHDQQALAIADGVTKLLTSRMSEFEAGVKRVEAAVKSFADRIPAPVAPDSNADVVLAEELPPDSKSNDNRGDDGPTDREPQGDTDTPVARRKPRPSWLGNATLWATVLNLVLLAAVLYAVLARPSAATAPALGDDFADRVAAKVTVPRADAALLQSIEKGVAGLQKPAAQPPAPPAVSAEDKRELLAAIKAAAAPAVPTDVLVVVTHGATMDAADYTEKLRNVVKDFRGKDGTVRVGLALGQAENLNVRVPVEDPGGKLDKIDAPNPTYKESPALLGGKVKNAFKDNRGRQRAVLVVSNMCDPVKSNAPGWNTLSDVHVVVVARQDLTGTDRERLAQWFEFADATRGTVHLISKHGQPDGQLDRQRAALEANLRRLVALP
ncbi:MAG TPA: hypothetical protein VD866_21965 [Urbifossiella sp.]|nr:hypothetical protein [Urbifossiella sp.]